MTLPNSAHPLLALDRATVRYGDATVLRDVSLAIHRGEAVAVVGPNGSGKSTLLRVLAGLVVPTAGSATLRNSLLAELTASERARQVAYVPQNTSIPFDFSVREIVAMGRTPYLPSWGFESSADNSVIEEAMTRMDLGPFAARSILDVSGGERQRAVIARALAQQPAVLLLDEPAAHLDLRYQVALQAFLRQLCRTAGLTTVTVSHDLSAVADSDRIVALVNGRIHATGPPDLVLTESTIREIFGCPALVDSHPRTGQPRVTVDWSAT